MVALVVFVMFITLVIIAVMIDYSDSGGYHDSGLCSNCRRQRTGSDGAAVAQVGKSRFK